MEEKKHVMPKHPTREQVASALRRCLEHEVNNVQEYRVETDEHGTVTTTIVLVEQST